VTSDQVRFIHVGDWEPDARLGKRGREYCEPAFDAFEYLFSRFLADPPNLLFFTGDYANHALFIEKALSDDRRWARKRFERLFEILATMRSDFGTRCYWTIASHEWPAFEIGAWPFSLKSVAAAFRYFACPSGEVDYLADLDVWVLGFGNLGGDKSRAGHPNAEAYRRAAADVWRRPEDLSPKMARTCIVSASEVMRGLQSIGAAYAGFGGLQVRHHRSNERAYVLGRPYHMDRYGHLQALVYVDGVVGGEVSPVDAPLPASG
jgi:hypothetical protein